MDKQKKYQAVKLLREYRQQIIAELENVDETIRRMSDDETKTSTNKPITKTPQIMDNANIWPTLTAQEAVARFLELHPTKVYRASEIGRGLIKHGVLGSNKKSFASMIATTVRRVVEKGNAVQTTVNINGREVAGFRHQNTDS